MRWYDFVKLGIGIMVVLIILNLGLTLYFNIIKPEMDFTGIEESQKKLVREVDQTRAEIEKLKDTTASKEDIGELNNRLDKIEIGIANINPQVVQDINIFNKNTWINNYNIRIIFSFTFAIISYEIMKFIFWANFFKKILISKGIIKEEEYREAPSYTDKEKY